MSKRLDDTFAMPTLSTFESLVLSQRPALEPWEPVTDYSFEARLALEEPQADLLREVFRPVSMTDAGCGFGHLMRLMAMRGVRVRGLDLYHRWPDSLKKKAMRADLSAAVFNVPHDWRSDLVVCREVLEHLTLRQIRRAVTNLCALSLRYVYVTTRFSSESDLLRVETMDALDPTHITLPSKDLLRLLFVLEGFQRRPLMEARMDWMHKGRVLVYERAA